MIVEVKVPSPGESISEVEIAQWLVSDGDAVEKDQDLAEIESEKATLTLVASASGKIKILAQAGKAIGVGLVACSIDTEGTGTAPAPAEPAKAPEQKPAPEPVKAQAEKKPEPPQPQASPEAEKVKVTPLAKKLMDEHKLSIDDVLAGLRRITTADVEAVAALPKTPAAPATPKPAPQSAAPSAFMGDGSREAQSQKMSALRKKLSERLVSVKNETAMLTTFNEVDMSQIMELRQKFQPAFQQKHGVKVGFMSFFLKAVSQALLLYPEINSAIDGDEVISYRYADIGIAVQSPKGLLVPVIRNVESKSLADIELAIKDFADKSKKNKISLDEMTGGTFTVTNGGTFGSLLSTPIINPPQSAILGMHNIVDRPVAVNGKVEIRPMMYVALSYDHRIIDGKSSVGFLVKVKELTENPWKMLLGGQSPDQILLNI